MFEQAGLPASADIERVPNSFKALRLAELARAQGRFGALHARLFDAYWARARDIGDDDVLVEEAVAAGLDAADTRELLAGDAFADVVRGRTTEVLEAGAQGVPAWIVDDRVLVPGAQPEEVFERVLTRLGHEPSGT